MLSTLLIALSLSLDAFAVSVSSGMSVKALSKFHALRACFFFGLFQFLMPLAGWFLGMTVASFIEGFDHWIAFGLLAFIGGKMILDGIKSRARKGENEEPSDIRRPGTLLLLALATSIDALAVGLSFSFIGQGIFIPAALIGAVTFTVCLAGFVIGSRAGRFFGKSPQIAGGLILIGIGVKILAEHLA